MRKKVLISILLLAVCFLSGCSSNLTPEHAKERAEEYAQAINYEYENPEKIYAFMCRDFRNQMTEEEFCKAFKKERTYPYITPLYLNSDPRVKLSGDKKTGTVEYDQAARIVGMVYDIRLVYENGDYYVMDWEDFLDGSYLDKFEDIPYSLDWYY